MNQTVSISDKAASSLQELPYFGVAKIIPKWAIPELEAAVKDFMQTSHMPDGIDASGFYHQTLEAIANSTYLGGNGDFWLATHNGRVVVYGLAYVSKDIDHRLCYHISQMWVAKDFRGKPIVREWWEMIRQRAKDCFCKHLVISSSRNSKAYQRFLGHGMREYVTLLKEEI